jgi:hypothetical protein
MPNHRHNSAPPHAVALAFLSVILEGDLLFTHHPKTPKEPPNPVGHGFSRDKKNHAPKALHSAEGRSTGAAETTELLYSALPRTDKDSHKPHTRRQVITSP